MLHELTPDELEVITSIFDRLEAGYWMGDVFQWAASTFQQFLGILDFNAIFDAWAGVPTLADCE